MSIFSTTDVLVRNSFVSFFFGFYYSFGFVRGAELYAQNPNLIKKDENRIRADEVDHEYHRQSTLPSIPTMQNDRNVSSDL